MEENSIWHTSCSCSGGRQRPAAEKPSSESESTSRICSSGGGGNSTKMITGRRKRWGILLHMVVIALIFSPLTVVGSEDWTLQCPSGCKCTWVSGKKTADCRGSHWTTIPSGLSPEVQVLEMAGTTIKMLPKDAFKSVGLVNLQKVFLQGCRIERIDRDAFRDLEIMIEVDLSGNLVSSLDMEAFSSNVRLRELKMSRNPLTQLTGTSFPPLGYLKLLDLSECHLSSFPKKTFQNLQVLETLALNGNRFTHLSEELLRPLVKLKSLSLAGNPWRCDCRLKSIRDWVIAKNLFQHHTKCVEPSHVANFPWDQLLSADFACRPEIVSVQINGKPTDALLVHTDIGSDITLQCLVRGNPPPDLKWVRDGQVLTNTSRSYGKSYYLHIGEEEDFDAGDYRGRWVNLTIQKTDPEDAGEYTCVGSNQGGVVEKNLTLNFQDVPSGAGVGHGLGGLGSGAYRDSGWILILISVIVLIVFITILVSLLVCFCSRRRRVKTTRAQDLKSDGKLNGSVAGYIECPNSCKKLDTSSAGGPQIAKVRSGDTTPSNSSPRPFPPPVNGGNGTLQHCATSALTSTTTRGKPVTVPCSADVELTYRINPMHSTNNNGMMGTYRRQARCTFQRGDAESSTYYDSTQQQQQMYHNHHHEMIEMHHPHQTGVPSRIGVLETVEPSSGYHHHHNHHHQQPFTNNSAEILSPSQRTSQAECEDKDVLPPPPQYAPVNCNRSSNCSLNCRNDIPCCANAQQQQQFVVGDCCSPYPPPPTQNLNHHHHHHMPHHHHIHNPSNEPAYSQTPGGDVDSSRFESDNIVVMSRQASTEYQNMTPNEQIVPVHSFCPGNYPSAANRTMRLPERVPPPPPQRDHYSTLSCNYSPVNVANGSSTYSNRENVIIGANLRNHSSSSTQQTSRSGGGESSCEQVSSEGGGNQNQQSLTQNQITKETQTGGVTES